jgi:hypothetical protein
MPDSYVPTIYLSRSPWRFITPVAGSIIRVRPRVGERMHAALTLEFPR